MCKRNAELKKLCKRNKSVTRTFVLIIFGLMICLLFQSQACSAYSKPIMKKNDGMNHWEWQTVCLHAMDVDMHLSEERRYVANGRLAAAVLEKSGLQIRYAPDYKVSDASCGVDLSMVKSRVNTDGYRVRLRTESGEYIDILLKVTPDVITAVNKTGGASQSGRGSGGSAKVSPMPSKAGIAAAAAAAAVLMAALKFELVPDIRVIRWHKRMKAKNVKGDTARHQHQRKEK